MGARVEVVPNRVFLGYEWQFYRPRYEPIVRKLHEKYPVHFLAVGRRAGQPAEDLYGGIKRAIGSSTAAVFDASRGNANVSLEFGFAEALETLKTYLLVDAVTLPTKSAQGTPIISDLAGVRANQYKNDDELAAHLEAIARNHAYTRRFLRFCRAKSLKGQHRKPYVRIIHALGEYVDDFKVLRRELVDDLLQQWKPRITEAKLSSYLQALNKAGLLTITRGNHFSSRAYIS